MVSISGGIGKIDIEDWKSHTRLKHCKGETPVVKWFWEIVDSYSEEMRARLLQFVTGSSRVRKLLFTRRLQVQSANHFDAALKLSRL